MINNPLIRRARSSMTSFVNHLQGTHDTGDLSTQFTRCSNMWTSAAHLIRKYADKVELSLALCSLLYYRKWPYKAMYMIGVLANLCWLRHYLRAVTAENGDRLSAGMRWRIGYSVLRRLVKLEGRMNLHIPIIGTFRFDARFDSMDHHENKFSKALTSVNNMVVPNSTTIAEVAEKLIAMEQEEEKEENDVQEDVDVVEAVDEKPTKKNIVDIYSGSNDDIATDFNSVLEWRRGSLGSEPHKEWRNSMDSVVDELEELKPYLLVGDEEMSQEEEEDDDEAEEDNEVEDYEGISFAEVENVKVDEIETETEEKEKELIEDAVEVEDFIPVDIPVDLVAQNNTFLVVEDEKENTLSICREQQLKIHGGCIPVQRQNRAVLEHIK